MESSPAVLDELYGGSLEPTVRKRGDPVRALWAASWMTPILWTVPPCWSRRPPCWGAGAPSRTPGTRHSAPTTPRQERENLVTRIRAQVNDKRQYAQVRVVAEMCAGEPFSGWTSWGMRRPGGHHTPKAVGLLPAGASHCPDRVLLLRFRPPERVRAAVQAIVDGLPPERRAPRGAPKRERSAQPPGGEGWT